MSDEVTCSDCGNQIKGLSHDDYQRIMSHDGEVLCDECSLVNYWHYRLMCVEEEVAS